MPPIYFKSENTNRMNGVAFTHKNIQMNYFWISRMLQRSHTKPRDYTTWTFLFRNNVNTIKFKCPLQPHIFTCIPAFSILTMLYSITLPYLQIHIQVHKMDSIKRYTMCTDISYPKDFQLLTSHQHNWNVHSVLKFEIFESKDNSTYSFLKQGWIPFHPSCSKVSEFAWQP